jgi:hypothetical protein
VALSLSTFFKTGMLKKFPFVVVSGSDLIDLAQEDLLADLGATSIQVSTYMYTS